jgi:hypothetical protein
MKIAQLTLLLFFMTLFRLGAQTYSGPLTITAGGTYTGNWESTDPNVPAIDIKTTQAVIIQDSRIRSKGIHINIKTTGSNVTVKNVCAVGVNPGIAGIAPGRFIYNYSPNNLLVENCYMESTGGIYVLQFSGTNPATQTIKIRKNQFKNIEGRASTGTGYRTDDTGYKRYQAVQFDKVQNLANAEISWNEVINEPFNSRSEDVINMYLSSGTAASNILIHDNYIYGSYPANPALGSFSGGGIITDGAPTTLAEATAYVKVYNNQVLATSNYGIAIASGHDNEMYNNKVVGSGYLADKTFIKAQNVGAYVWNLHASTFYSNNKMYNNVVGWNHINKNTGTIERNDSWFPDCMTGGCTGNTAIAGTLTAANEDQEYPIWKNKLSTNSVVIGSTVCGGVVTSAAEISRQSPFTFYPNPAANSVFIQGPIQDIKFVEVYNILGIKVKSLTAVSSVDISDLSSGSYFLVVNTAMGNVMKIVVKQ